MLENLVVLALMIGIVANLYGDLVAETQVGDLFLRVVVLSLRERDAVNLDSKVLSRVTDQSAPAAADVQHPFAGLQTQFAANHVQLVVLSLIERVVPVR